MTRDPELAECLQICKKLIREIEHDSLIPADKFAGKTADTLVRMRKEQVSRLEKMYKKLMSL